MNLFEDLGSGLGSLSLHDSQRRYNVFEATDTLDAMDIDSLSGSESDSIADVHDETRKGFAYSDNDSEIFYNGEVAEDENVYDLNLIRNENKEDDHDEAAEAMHDSLLGILSPTALGARLALKPQKLLMPPPSMSDERGHQSRKSSSVDYEFDTSDMKRSVADKGHQQAKDPFSHDVPNNSLSKEPTSQKLGGSMAASSLWPSNRAPSIPSNFASSFGSLLQGSSSIFNSSLAQFPQQQTVVHHHHYYPNTEHSQFTPSHMQLGVLTDRERAKESTLSLRSQKQPSPDVSNVLAKRNSITAVTSVHTNNDQLLTRQHEAINPYLPSPWDARAMPAEKLPYVLLSYLQLLTNTLLSAFALHILVSMVQAVRSDVSHKMATETNNLLVEIALCQRSYRENHCDPAERVPALEKMCDYWEKCMRQDPIQIGNRSLIGAHTLGVVLNSLVEPLGLKFLGVGAFLVVLLFACNFGFGYIRARAYYGMAQAQRERI